MNKFNIYSFFLIYNIIKNKFKIMKSFKQFIKEYSEYSPLQIGLKIKFNLKDGSENIGTITQIYSDGVEAKLDKPRYDRSGSLVTTSLVNMNTLTGVMFNDKWYTKDEFFNDFA